jgi:uncharacterized repeat protein (TIGR01451 family)
MKKFFIKTGGIAITILLALQGACAVQAWGPERRTFEMDKPATYVTFNSITNNQSSESVGIGDERNFVRVRKAGETTFTDQVEISDADAKNGQEFEVYVFYHNNAASNYNLTAENTKVFAYFPGIISGDSTAETGAKITASNANPTSVWDEADFINKSSVGVRLRYVENSATIYWNGGRTTAKIGEDMFTSGALIGYCAEGETNCALDGEVPGCAEYSGYIIYKVKVEQASIYLSKMASTDGVNYYDNVTAKVGDTIHYKVVAKNLGSIATTKIAIKDQLTTGLVATTDAIFKDTATSGATKTEALSSDFFTSTGALTYQLSVGGAGWYIEYDAKITDEVFGDKTCGVARLINTVYMDYALADGGYGTLGNQASVLVSDPCEDEPVEDCTTNPDAPGCQEKNCKTNPEMEGCQELPSTGPLEIVMAIVVILGIGGGGYYLYRTKKTLNKVESAAKGETTPKAEEEAKELAKDAEPKEVAKEAPKEEPKKK